jgi:Ca2+-dependent lipid-binding protein
MSGYELHLRIVEAKDVPSMDLIGLSDPFCVLQLSTSRQIYRTKVCDNTKNPVWNAEFRIQIPTLDTTSIFIVLKDNDDTSDDDPISRTSIPISSLGIGKMMDQWIRLESLGKHGGGELHVIAVVLETGSPSPWSKQT